MKKKVNKDKEIVNQRITVQNLKHQINYKNDQMADLQLDLRDLVRKLEEEEHDLQKLVGVRPRRASKGSVSH